MQTIKITYKKFQFQNINKIISKYTHLFKIKETLFRMRMRGQGRISLRAARYKSRTAIWRHIGGIFASHVANNVGERHDIVFGQGEGFDFGQAALLFDVWYHFA